MAHSILAAHAAEANRMMTTHDNSQKHRQEESDPPIADVRSSHETLEVSKNSVGVGG